jgi:hypothetical protein
MWRPRVISSTNDQLGGTCDETVDKKSMNGTLNDAAQPIAENIFAQASAHSEMLEDKIGVKLSEEQFNRIFEEFVALLQHISVRATFDVIGREKGGEFVNLIYAHVSALGTSFSLSERHPNPPFISREKGIYKLLVSTTTSWTGGIRSMRSMQICLAMVN